MPGTTPDDLSGVVLGDRYRVDRQIGSGGMGAVYEAHHQKIGKRVAIKVLHPGADDVIAERLQQEARLASAIGHEHIVDITDVGETEDGRTYVVMEFLDGHPLSELLERGMGILHKRTLRIGRQLASALGAAHQKGIIHRDIKPENVFLIQRGGRDFVKIVDFGISTSVDGPSATETGGVVYGTRAYMAPELIANPSDIDERSDIYSLGVLLDDMIAGVEPDAVGPGDESGAPHYVSDLKAVIARARQRDPKKRYPSCADLDADLAIIEKNIAIFEARDPRITTSALGVPTAHSQDRSKVRTLWALAAVAVLVAALAVTLSMVLTRDTKGPSSSSAPSGEVD